jgi:hypothetical protein
MDDVTLLAWIEKGKTLSVFLVALGVVGEFLGDRLEKPVRKRLDEMGSEFTNKYFVPLRCQGRISLMNGSSISLIHSRSSRVHGLGLPST